jgi:7-cyano-7-deazaguanine reductase
MNTGEKPRSWSDRGILKSLKNPSEQRYVVTMENPEVTFLGAEQQPDFAVVLIEFTPGERIVELKSLKYYFHDFRERVLSYERLINVVFDDLMAVYQPTHLRLTIMCRPRGGITSKLVADSSERE